MKHGLKVFLEHYKSKEYWYIKYITWCIISIVCLAILVQILKEIGVLPAQKIFDFLNQWAMVLSAAATLLLASTAFWAIMDNRHGRIVDRKERLLNEIIEWATDIIECCREFEVPLVGNGITNRDSLLRRIESNRVTKLNTMTSRSKYLSEIAFKLNTKLKDDIEITNKNILDLKEILLERAHVEIEHDKGKVKIEEVDKVVKRYDGQIDRVEESAGLIIKAASKIKSDL